MSNTKVDLQATSCTALYMYMYKCILSTFHGPSRPSLQGWLVGEWSHRTCLQWQGYSWCVHCDKHRERTRGTPWYSHVTYSKEERRISIAAILTHNVHTYICLKWGILTSILYIHACKTPPHVRPFLNELSLFHASTLYSQISHVTFVPLKMLHDN